MTDAIAKLNELLRKVLAYGPPKKNLEKQKQRVRQAKSRKKRVGAR